MKKLFGWTPPPKPYIKLNTDGARKQSGLALICCWRSHQNCNRYWVIDKNGLISSMELRRYLIRTENDKNKGKFAIIWD